MSKKKAADSYTPPEFLTALLDARSPSGHEFEAHAVLDKYLKPAADEYEKDALGNRLATLNPGGDPSVLLAGHMDELGLIIKHVDDNGFLYFQTLGGHDVTMISGRRVRILTKNGPVKGVTGKRAIHLMTQEERKKIPKTEDIWIDIGARSRDEALGIVRLGDPAVYDHTFEMLRGSVGVARAFDNKTGCYVVCEVLRRLAKAGKCAAKVIAAATSQEEVGTRGAAIAGNRINPHYAICVDVAHATDHPDCDARKHGKFKLGGGPIIGRGPNISPVVFERLIDLAEEHNLPYQVEAEPTPTPNDARVLQVARDGAATATVSIPLRYMHTPSELVDLEDLETTVQLLQHFCASLKKGDYAHY